MSPRRKPTRASAGAALQTYRGMRDFTKTAEPRGGRRRAAGHSFVIQEHHARRLHYDFRLELDGVLKSWAVPKEPSRDPADKRLAVRTEDHPLDYGSFEGTIPKGQYGAGKVKIWDHGEWQPLDDPRDGLKKGKLSFVLKGRRLKGAWALVRMHARPRETKENWLLIKMDDAAARTNDN
jgi:bifunctional non-homologous end joining protein LigD